MPLLTKKFTRDSLKRASGAGGPHDSEDTSNAEKIRQEMNRSRAKSLRNRNVLQQQYRRYRSLSRGPASPHRSVGLDNAKGKTSADGPKAPSFSHPSDDYSQAYNEAELLTQMSSLTEPTWAPSVVGGSDLTSGHHRLNYQNQRSRTGNYNNARNQTRMQYNNPKDRQNRATITISTSKNQKETKVLVLDERENEERSEDSNTPNSSTGIQERASVGSEGIEVHRIERDEGREDEIDSKSTSTSTERLRVDTIRSSDLRDDISSDDVAPSTPRSRHSSSRNRGGDRISSRTRGRSGRPSSNRRSKRSSSVSSRQSTQSSRTSSTAPTISKHSSTASSLSISTGSRQSKVDAQMIAPKRRMGSVTMKSSRSASVPPSSSNSKRSQRTSSVPPPTFKNVRKFGGVGTSNTSGDNNIDVSDGIRYANTHKNDQRSTPTTTKDARNAMLDIASTMAETASPSKSQSSVTFVTASRHSGVAAVDPPSMPSSAIEAARMSLRPRLRRSSSNRSISSTQSESIISTTSRQSGTPTSKVFQKQRRSPSCTPASPCKNTYSSRTHKLAQDTRAKKIHDQIKKKRREQEMEQYRRHQREEETRQRNKARKVALITTTEDEEPQHTTVTTLISDFVVFHLLLFFALPQRVVLWLWSRIFSKKWTARRKNVLVTGANSALGSETARQFATEGANLILISNSTTSVEGDLNWLTEECLELGSGKIRSYTADLSNATSIDLTLRQAAKDFNDTFDIVILNGENKSHACLFEEILDVHQIEKMVTENTLGCIMSLHYALKHVPKTSDSRIVVLSSSLGMVASPYRSVYGATQYALKGFCDSIRMELKDTYTDRRAPKVCLASFPELVGQHVNTRDNVDPRMSRMGAEIAPMKTRSWAGVPLQQAVHDLLDAIISGERDYGSPKYVSAWRFFQVVAPCLVDFSIFQHIRKTQYRPVEAGRDGLKGRKGAQSGGGASVSNKTWS